MSALRWDYLLASALLSGALVLSAYLLAPPRYTAFAYERWATIVRIDQRTGEIISCLERRCTTIIMKNGTATGGFTDLEDDIAAMTEN